MIVSGKDKNIIKNPHWPRQRWTPWLWLLAYPLAWALLFAGSSSYWFLPAGLRMGTLWIMPRRWWWRMAVLEWATVLAITLHRGVFHTTLPLLLSTFSPWCVYALVVMAFNKREIFPPTPQSMLRLLLCGLLAAIANTLGLTLATWLNGDLSGQALHVIAFMYALGDLVGIIIVAPLMLLVRDQLLVGWQPWPRLLGKGLVLLPVTMAVGLGLSPLRSVMRYPVVLALFPLFWVAFSFGWRAAAVAITLLSTGVYILGLVTPLQWEPGQLQLLLAATAAAALLLGVSSDVLRTQGRALEASVDMLMIRSKQLVDVANRLTSQQEDERRRIGSELHDQIGQDMTAIATRLRVVDRTLNDERVSSGIRSIESLVTDAQSHLRDVIHNLHPLVLDRFGLVRALAEGTLAEMAREEDINFQCQFHGDIDGLDANVASAIYRICQEATTNCVRHGCGHRVRIRLSRIPEHPRGSLLTMLIEDGAGKLTLPLESVSLGLQGIVDRAHALGADYAFDPYTGHPRHWLQLRLPT